MPTSMSWRRVTAGVLLGRDSLAPDAKQPMLARMSLRAAAGSCCYEAERLGTTAVLARQSQQAAPAPA
jgi:hypothetical protein